MNIKNLNENINQKNNRIILFSNNISLSLLISGNCPSKIHGQRRAMSLFLRTGKTGTGKYGKTRALPVARHFYRQFARARARPSSLNLTYQISKVQTLGKNNKNIYNSKKYKGNIYFITKLGRMFSL